MNKDIENSIKNGELVLFLGAGASKTCKTRSDEYILDGRALAKELANRASLEYSDEDLEDVYGAVRDSLGARLDAILEGLFRHVKPSDEYMSLAKFAWRRIYTLNIDDGLERAFKSSMQNSCIRLSDDPIEDRDPFYQKIDLVKLNGSIEQLHRGIIFSASEYAKATNQARPWYEQCGSDFIRVPFLFVGTKLKEPLLKFHIERYKELNKRSPGKSYVITPSATDIEKLSLRQYNIEHIAGTLADFVSWLKIHFDKPLTPEDLANATLPQYAAARNSSNKEAFARLFDGVCLVKRDMAHGNREEGSIREFYKGFKPTWDDIVSGVPAELDILEECKAYLKDNLGKFQVISLVGPAGSGKSTLLMQLAYNASRLNNTIVYHFDEPPIDIEKTLTAMEQSARNDDNIIVAIDNVDFMSESIANSLESGRFKKIIIICSERESIWSRKTKSKIGKFCAKTFHINEFTERDAHNLLSKLQIYGSWTILGQMSEKARVSALVDKAGKQLLIALLEATYGRGFEKIIESDYKSLENEAQQIFFLTVGVITERNFSAPVGLVDRALAAGGYAGAGVMTNALGMVCKSQPCDGLI